LADADWATASDGLQPFRFAQWMPPTGQEQPYSEVTDSSRSLAQSTRSRHTRRFETVISTNWHSRFLLRGLFGVRMEGGAPHRAR
jgi:hypothetical protein